MRNNTTECGETDEKPRGARSVLEAIEGHDNNYTLIRIILAASVIYFHAFGMVIGTPFQDHLSNFILPITSVGGLAVEIFFFLSGLFVAQSLFKDKDVISFLLKRFFRIWPGFFVCILITSVIFVLVNHIQNISRAIWFSALYEYVVDNAIFKISYFIPDTLTSLQTSAVNGSIHTLPLEAKMYLALAAIALCGGASNRITLFVTAFLVIAITVSSARTLAGVSWIFPPTYSHVAYSMFFAGVLTFAVAHWIVPRVWQGIFLCAIVCWTEGLMHVLVFYLMVIWATLFIGESRMIGSLYRPKFDVSYGIYVYGWPSSQIVLLTTSPALNPYLLTVLSFIVSLLFATISWKFIERPSIAFGRHLSEVKLSDLKAMRGLVASRLFNSYEFTVFATLAFLFFLSVALARLTMHHPIAPIVPMAQKLLAFGPSKGKAGQQVNPQPDGSSAIWVLLDRMPAAGDTVIFAGEPLATSMGNNSVTAVVDNRLLATPGDKSIYVERRLVNCIERTKSVVMHIDP